MRVFLQPEFRTPDQGDGGIRRVVEAQKRWLPEYGFSFVDSIEQADIVATHATIHPRVPVDLPWVTHCHGLYYQDFGWEEQWYHKANKELSEILREADHITAPSEWVAQTIRRAMWTRPTVLYHGVDFDDWQSGEPEDYILWNKARQDESCDPRPVNTLAEMDDSLYFVSTFGEKAHNVKITGSLPFAAAKELVKRAGLYLCTARETFGIGTIEAMAAGVPVVGWAWGGQREIIRHGETGWLVPPGDYDGLLEGIAWAKANRKSISAACKADVLERWTWERAIERYARLYEGMITGRTVLGSRITSVIVPCYNLGRFLPDALNSVLAQTDPRWECIVVDDASTDNTAEVVGRFATQDSRFKYIRNEANLHVSLTRNKGIKASKGDYIVCLDADDMLESNAIEVLRRALDHDRSIDIAYGKLRLISEDGTPRNSVHEWPDVFRFEKQIVGENQVPTMCMMRRSVIERTGGYRKRISPVEDADLWTRAASIGLVPKLVTDSTTLVYRLRQRSLSRSMPQKNWVDWYPWSRDRSLLPFAAAAEPRGTALAWPVHTYEPTHIAVIIPVGPGHEDLVIDALDSVEAQTYRNWECIVINDTGKPLEIPHSWAKVIDTEGHKGPAYCRNLGIKSSNAPLFVPLDADDFLQADALSMMLNVYKANKGFVYSQWIDDFGKETKVYDPAEYDPKLLLSKGCLHAVTALYSKADWETVGGFDESLSHWEDWDFQLRLAKVGVCGTKIHKPLFTYRKHTGYRRDDNYATFEAGKDAILKKWKPFWDGKEILMACSSCPSGRKSAMSPMTYSGGSSSIMSGGDAPNGAVLLEFMGTSPSIVAYKGRETGTVYRFGNASTHKTRYVLAPDVPGLIAINGLFRVAGSNTTPESNSPVLDVAIPPEPTPEVSAANTLADLRAMLPNLTLEETMTMLAKEKAGANRIGAVKLLEAHRTALQELVGV